MRLVRLVGVQRHCVTVWDDPDTPFAACRFRPLAERKNDGTAFVEALRRVCLTAPSDMVDA